MSAPQGNPPTTPAPNACYSCGGTGHYARDCPSQSQGGYGGGKGGGNGKGYQPRNNYRAPVATQSTDEFAFGDVVSQTREVTVTVRCQEKDRERLRKILAGETDVAKAMAKDQMNQSSAAPVVASSPGTKKMLNDLTVATTAILASQTEGTTMMGELSRRVSALQRGGASLASKIRKLEMDSLGETCETWADFHSAVCASEMKKQVKKKKPAE
jgi:hypothetical protein